MGSVNHILLALYIRQIFFVILFSQALWSIRDYVSNMNGGADGQHVALAGWFWWCWNANSGDTGGLVRQPQAPKQKFRLGH